ncbi:MAG: phosphate acyltransferase PlsX [Mycoplasmatales bacterium]
MYKIGFDASGGDHAYEATVAAALDFVKNSKNKVVLFGDEEQIKNHLTTSHGQIEIVNCTEYISSNEEAVSAIKTKKDSAIVVGANALKKGEIDALLSAGSTGALVAAGIFVCGRIRGIERPALSGIYPSTKKPTPTMMLDIGANSEPKPKHLLQYSQMGSIYMNALYDVENPKVGLLNIGTEENKGSELYQETHQLLKNSNLNFYGNEETRNIIETQCDVLVIDGVAGNFVLKAMEGIVSFFGSALKDIFQKNPVNMVAGLIVKNNLSDMKKQLDYKEIGATPILGINHVLMKAHGSSNQYTFVNALKATEKVIESQYIDKIKIHLKQGEN